MASPNRSGFSCKSLSDLIFVIDTLTRVDWALVICRRRSRRQFGISRSVKEVFAIITRQRD